MRLHKPKVSNVFLGVGLLYLYIPIVLVIVFSFNASKLVTVWSGFSLQWYAELFHNERVVDAALLSLKVATISATLATVLGTLAGLALDRLGLFGGRLFFVIMICMLLVIPDTILGLSQLLVFVTLQQWLGWPSERGEFTLIISHCTLALAYVAVIVRARLAGMNHDAEEAALDLGAKPWQVMLTVTLPLAAPAIIAGWLLSFSLSFDDLVVASFTSGPGASTLPLLIYSKIRLGVTPDINALSAIIVFAVTLMVLTAGLIWRKDR